MKETVNLLKAAGLRSKVKIVIGSLQANEEVRDYSGVDGFRIYAISGVALAKKWIGGK